MNCTCKAAYEAAARVCESEWINDSTGSEADKVYNHAVADCVRAIRSLPLCGRCESEPKAATVEGMPEITRYTPVVIRASTNSAEGFSGLHPDPNGHWVEYSECRANAERLRAELDQWRIALMGLTAGGSEFTSPQACVEYVRATRTSQHETILKFKAENALLKVALKDAITPNESRITLIGDIHPTSMQGLWRERHAAAIAIAGKP